MGYLDYKFLHLLAIVGLFLSIGAFVTESARFRIRTLSFSVHGLAMLLIFVSGFGMLAKIGIKGNVPTFVWYKIAIWFCLGFLPPLLRRHGYPFLLFFISLALGAGGAYFGLYH